MKAKDVLKLTQISRKHLSRLVKQGKFRVIVKPNGQYDYNPDDIYQYIGKTRKNLNVIYARVSTTKQKIDLARQIELLESFCLAQGLKIDHVFSEVASGINFGKQFFSMLDLVIDGQVERVFINYKDRLSRIGFGFFEHLFQKFGTEIVVANAQQNDKLDSEESLSEIMTLLHCFSTKDHSSIRIKRAIEILDERDNGAA